MKTQQINHLIEVIKLFKELNSDMNANMMLAFLEVAKGNGVTGRDIEVAFDIPTATAARLLRYFDRIQVKGKSGLDLFRVELDPLDYKAKLRYLNDNGLDFLLKVEKAYTKR